MCVVWGEQPLLVIWLRILLQKRQRLTCPLGLTRLNSSCLVAYCMLLDGDFIGHPASLSALAARNLKATCCAR